MDQQGLSGSYVFRGLGVVAAALIAAGAISPAFSAAPLTKAKVAKIAKKVANKQITKRAPDLTVGNALALDGMPPSAFASSTSEPYHEVGAPGEPAFGTGWSNEAAGQSSAAFYKDPIGVVHLKGIVLCDGCAETLFTLPVGYRLSQASAFPILRGAPTIDPAFLIVRADGRLQVFAGGGGGATATFLLDGVSFRAEG